MHCSGRTNSKLNMLLIGPEARLHLMSKRWMSSASTSVFYPLPHLLIRTSTFYHRPNDHTVLGLGLGVNILFFAPMLYRVHSSQYWSILFCKKQGS